MLIKDIQKTYATVIGAVLVLVGLLGFFSNPLVGKDGLFGANVLQSVLHIAGGAVGVWLGMKGNAKAYNMYLGIVAGVVGILGFVPGISGLLASILSINAAISVLHIVIAAVSLGLVYGLKK